MSTPAISSLIAAIGGKGALPALENLLPENGLPLDFAALLAEQTLPAGQATSALVTSTSTLPTSANVPSDQQPPPLALKEIVAQTAPVKRGATVIAPVDGTRQVTNTREMAENAANVLAALSSSGKQPVATIAITEPENVKKQGNLDRKATDDSQLVAIDPGAAAQYVVPVAVQAAQNRLPEKGIRDNSTPTGSLIENTSTIIPAKENRPALAEQTGPGMTESAPALPFPATQQAAPLAEPRIIPRSDTANAAILAGDTNPGNSGNTPAVATALAATANANGTAMPPQQNEPPAITTHLNHANWSHDLGNRVVWLAKNDQQVAKIDINPPQLGPVQISISLNGDQASATFASPHPEVRQAIQDSLPQLREMLTNAGISLGQANVGSQLPSQNREASYQFANEARSSGENAILSPDSHASNNQAATPIQRGRGLVDLFA